MDEGEGVCFDGIFLPILEQLKEYYNGEDEEQRLKHLSEGTRQLNQILSDLQEQKIDFTSHQMASLEKLACYIFDRLGEHDLQHLLDMAALADDVTSACSMALHPLKSTHASMESVLSNDTTTMHRISGSDVAESEDSFLSVEQKLLHAKQSCQEPGRHQTRDESAAQGDGLHLAATLNAPTTSKNSQADLSNFDDACNSADSFSVRSMIDILERKISETDSDDPGKTRVLVPSQPSPPANNCGSSIPELQTHSKLPLGLTTTAEQSSTNGKETITWSSIPVIRKHHHQPKIRGENTANCDVKNVAISSNGHAYEAGDLCTMNCLRNYSRNERPRGVDKKYTPMAIDKSMEMQNACVEDTGSQISKTQHIPVNPIHTNSSITKKMANDKLNFGAKRRESDNATPNDEVEDNAENSFCSNTVVKLTNINAKLEKFLNPNEKYMQMEVPVVAEAGDQTPLGNHSKYRAETNLAASEHTEDTFHSAIQQGISIVPQNQFCNPIHANLHIQNSHLENAKTSDQGPANGTFSEEPQLQADTSLKNTANMEKKYNGSQIDLAEGPFCSKMEEKNQDSVEADPTVVEQSLCTDKPSEYEMLESDDEQNVLGLHGSSGCQRMCYIGFGLFVILMMIAMTTYSGLILFSYNHDPTFDYRLEGALSHAFAESAHAALIMNGNGPVAWLYQGYEGAQNYLSNVNVRKAREMKNWAVAKGNSYLETISEMVKSYGNYLAKSVNPASFFANLKSVSYSVGDGIKFTADYLFIYTKFMYDSVFEKISGQKTDDLNKK